MLPEKDVEVGTIDNFQGKEFEAVVVSTVRSNMDGRIGFLSSERRLNVALTRAKRGLIVVCNLRAFNCAPWEPWLQAAAHLGCTTSDFY